MNFWERLLDYSDKLLKVVLVWKLILVSTRGAPPVDPTSDKMTGEG